MGQKSQKGEKATKLSKGHKEVNVSIGQKATKRPKGHKEVKRAMLTGQFQKAKRPQRGHEEVKMPQKGHEEVNYRYYPEDDYHYHYHYY